MCSQAYTDSCRTAMLFSSYTLPATAVSGGYETWLREVENPFFNAIPGVDRYENWEIVDAKPRALRFTHFDFMILEHEADLERVWFNRDLDEFRKGWVRKWGYGASGATPPPGSAHGYLARGVAASIDVRGAWCTITGGEIVDRAEEHWSIVEAIRKHYAIGPAPDGEPWHRPVAKDEGPGLRDFSVAFAASESAARSGSTPSAQGAPVLVARLLAAPGFDGSTLDQRAAGKAPLSRRLT